MSKRKRYGRESEITRVMDERIFRKVFENSTTITQWTYDTVKKNTPTLPKKQTEGLVPSSSPNTAPHSLHVYKQTGSLSAARVKKTLSASNDPQSCLSLFLLFHVASPACPAALQTVLDMLMYCDMGPSDVWHSTNTIDSLFMISLSLQWRQYCDPTQLDFFV